jgi:prepilin-type N-terminal cleavage/methylation domain-containing protein
MTLRRKERGFTLVELMVALVAGLIVSMAMVGLSKQAMNTFHEEARNAAAEAALRTGLERLRSDLSMAGFLSTGNIVADNRTLGFGGNIPTCIGNSTTTASFAAAPGIKRLAGIHLYEGGATAAANTLEKANNLAPDMIDIGGNFTNGEDYVGHLVTASAATSLGDTACGSQVFQLDMNTATGWRLAAACGATPCGATSGPFFNAFHPGTSSTTQYIVRIADNSNPTLFQYALLCATNPVVFAAGPGTGANPNFAFVNIDSTTTPVGDTANSSGNCKLKNWDAGNGITRIAAVQVVEWDLQPQSAPTTLPKSYGYMSTVDPNNLVLTRTFVDGLTGTPDATTIEAIAEYVIDVKFAFSVDTTAYGVATPVPGAYPVAPLLHMPFEAATAPNTNGGWAYDVSVGGATLGPQRIRSTRVRLVTRTALPDRSSTIAAPPGDVFPPVTTALSPYLYRYCLGTGAAPGICAANSVTWARARTAITEVALPNQSRFFY